MVLEVDGVDMVLIKIEYPRGFSFSVSFLFLWISSSINKFRYECVSGVARTLHYSTLL